MDQKFKAWADELHAEITSLPRSGWVRGLPPMLDCKLAYDAGLSPKVAARALLGLDNAMFQKIIEQRGLRENDHATEINGQESGNGPVGGPAPEGDGSDEWSDHDYGSGMEGT